MRVPVAHMALCVQLLTAVRERMILCCPLRRRRRSFFFKFFVSLLYSVARWWADTRKCRRKASTTRHVWKEMKNKKEERKNWHKIKAVVLSMVISATARCRYLRRSISVSAFWYVKMWNVSAHTHQETDAFDAAQRSTCLFRSYNKICYFGSAHLLIKIRSNCPTYIHSRAPHIQSETNTHTHTQGEKELVSTVAISAMNGRYQPNFPDD